MSRFRTPLMRSLLATVFALMLGIPAATVTAAPNPNPGDSDRDGLSNAFEKRLGTNKHDPDTDDDGLLDGEEWFRYFTNPVLTDSDEDGLDDGDEVLIYGTIPYDGDSDDDGALDGDEIAAGTDPLDPLE